MGAGSDTRAELVMGVLATTINGRCATVRIVVCVGVEAPEDEVLDRIVIPRLGVDDVPSTTLAAYLPKGKGQMANDLR